MPDSDLKGYVLAGGDSRRFGAGDKLQAEVDGISLMRHAIDSLPESSAEIVVVTAPGRRYDVPERHITDIFADAGPLGGVHAAVCDVPQGWAAVVAGDQIGGRSIWWDRLLAQRHRGAAVAFRDAHRWYPTFALYHGKLAPDIDERVRAGALSVQSLLDRVGIAVEPPCDFGDLRSIDTVDALAEAAQ